MRIRIPKKTSDRWLSAGAVLAVIGIVIMIPANPIALAVSGGILILMVICMGIGILYEIRGK